MNIKQLLTVSLFLVSFLVQAVQVADLCDEQGRTSLMNYVIAQEQAIIDANKVVDKAFILCFGDQYSRKSYRYVKIDNHCVPIHCSTDDILLRVSSCTEKQIQDLCSAESALEKIVSTTIKTIELMISQGADLQVKDKSGKTAADYCCTREIYAIFSLYGAPCSLKTWVYFNSGGVFFFGSLGVVVGWLGFSYFCSEKRGVNPVQVNQENKNIFDSIENSLDPIERFYRLPKNSANSKIAMPMFKSMNDCLKNCIKK